MRILPFDSTKSSISAKELVEEISKKVPAQVQIDMLKTTFPNGVVRGDEFSIGSTDGEEGKSLKIDINPRSPYFMKGQDFNGGIGIGGIVKIMMEGRNMKLPQIKEMFADYLDEAKSFVRDRPAENPVKRQIDLNTPFDAEHKYVNAEGTVICSVRKYLVRDGAGNPVLDTHERI